MVFWLVTCFFQQILFCTMHLKSGAFLLITAFCYWKQKNPLSSGLMLRCFELIAPIPKLRNKLLQTGWHFIKIGTNQESTRAQLLAVMQYVMFQNAFILLINMINCQATIIESDLTQRQKVCLWTWVTCTMDRTNTSLLKPSLIIFC